MNIYGTALSPIREGSSYSDDIEAEGLKAVLGLQLV